MTLLQEGKMLLLEVLSIREQVATEAFHASEYSEFTEGARQAWLCMGQLCQDSHPRLCEPVLSKATAGSVSSQFCSPFGPHCTQSPAHPYSPTMPLTPSIPLGSTVTNIFITCGHMPPALCLCSKPQVPKSPLPSLPRSFVPSGDIT